MKKEDLKQPILDYIQQNYAEDAFAGATQDEIFEDVYSVMEEYLDQIDFSDEEQVGQAIDAAIDGVQALYNCSEETLHLFDNMMEAEETLDIEFSEDDINFMQEQFSQTQFAEGSDIDQEAFNVVKGYIEQNEFAFMPSKKEKKQMAKDVRKLHEVIGIMPKRTAWQKFKRWALPKKEKSTVKSAWDTAKEVTRSPLGKVASAAVIQAGQVAALNKVQRFVDRTNAKTKQLGYSTPVDLVNDLFSESEEVVAARNAEAQERANEETVAAELPVHPEDAPKVNDSQETAAPSNTIPDLEPDKQQEKSHDFIGEVEKTIDNHDGAGEAQATNFANEVFDGIQNMYALIWRPGSRGFTTHTTKWNKDPRTQGQYVDVESRKVYDQNVVGPVDLRENLPGGGKGSRYFGKEDGSIGVGTLGTGGEYRQWRAQLPRNSRGGIAFDPKMLTAAMTDAIVEGMLAGTYYQSLDTGLQVSSGTIKRGYKGLGALITPTLDKAQERLERTGNKMANWALPDGPSATDIIDMDGKDAQEVIKVLDQTNYLNKLPEQARTLFLINLSKSGICYIDEKGTLTKRTIVEKLINTYQANPDEFLEILPTELQNIKDLYAKNALVNKDSINVDMIYNKLKEAKSVEQVRSILTDELNVLKKPLTSLADLVAAISNDFIMLKKSDSRQFKYVINKIARDVEIMARKNGEDSLSAISRAFLRNLSASVNEVDIKRTCEKLVISNIKYLNDLLDVKTAQFAEQDIDVEGGNVNMENSPVKSTGNRTNVAPSNLGQTAGWTQEEQDKGDVNPTTAPLEDAKDEATQQKFSIDEHFSQASTHQGQSSEMVSAPGFGVGAYMNL